MKRKLQLLHDTVIQEQHISWKLNDLSFINAQKKLEVADEDPAKCKMHAKGPNTIRTTNIIWNVQKIIDKSPGKSRTSRCQSAQSEELWMRTSGTSYMWYGEVISCQKRQERIVYPCKLLAEQVKTQISWNASVFLQWENLWTGPKGKQTVMQRPDSCSKGHANQVPSVCDGFRTCQN